MNTHTPVTPILPTLSITRHLLDSQVDIALAVRQDGVDYAAIVTLDRHDDKYAAVVILPEPAYALVPAVADRAGELARVGSIGARADAGTHALVNRAARVLHDYAVGWAAGLLEDSDQDVA